MRIRIQILISLIYLTTVIMSAQQSQIELLDSLNSKNLLDVQLSKIVDQDYIFTEIYLSETKNRDLLRYKKRRRYFTGPGLTDRAKTIIEILENHNYIERPISNKMIQMLNKSSSEDDKSEYIIDNISVWQYLSEQELHNSERSKKHLAQYIMELTECDLIDSIFVLETNTKRKFVEQLKQTIIFELPTTEPEFQPIIDKLNSKESIEIFGFNKEEYKEIKPIDISRVSKMNSILRDIDSELRILTTSDYDDLTWAGLITINAVQYEVLKKWDKGMDYPFSNVDWFVVKLFPDANFE